MDIRSGKEYPSNALSNFAPHKFVIDGIECASMEGFLQSLKFSNPEMQKHICTLVGYSAKMAGKGKDWYRDQTLYWLGKPYKRDSNDYQELLDRAYNELSKNTNFRKALLSTGDATITHSIGKINKSETVLTRSEFCKRLMNIREILKNQT